MNESAQSLEAATYGRGVPPALEAGERASQCQRTAATRSINLLLRGVGLLSPAQRVGLTVAGKARIHPASIKITVGLVTALMFAEQIDILRQTANPE